MPMFKYLNTINGLKNSTINPSTSAEMIVTLVVQHNIQNCNSNSYKLFTDKQEVVKDL